MRLNDTAAARLDVVALLIGRIVLGATAALAAIGLFYVLYVVAAFFVWIFQAFGLY